MSNLHNRAIYHELLKRVNSVSPSLGICDYAQTLSDAGVGSERISKTFDTFREYIMHECSPFMSSSYYEGICDTLASIISPTKYAEMADELEPTEHLSDPITLEKWDALSDEGKEILSRGWDAYSREGLGFVMLAMARLVLTSPVPIVDAQPGIYHGGEWVINAYVHKQDIDDCPEQFSARSDGFSVIWIIYPPGRSNVTTQEEFDHDQISKLFENMAPPDEP